MTVVTASKTVSSYHKMHALMGVTSHSFADQKPANHGSLSTVSRLIHQEQNDSTDRHEEQGGQTNRMYDFRFLTPKLPKTAKAKAFDQFLEKLAKVLGCSVATLEKQGYRCERLTSTEVNIVIPNSHHKAMFKVYSEGQASLDKLFAKYDKNTMKRDNYLSLLEMSTSTSPRA